MENIMVLEKMYANDCSPKYGTVEGILEWL